MAQVLTRVLTCVTGSNGGLYVGSAQVRCSSPDGSQGIVIYKDVYLSDQPIVVDGGSGADPSVSPFAMSAEDGALISASIIGCWVAAYLIRSVINVVQKGTES
jgi:hypothetical protein